MYLTITRYDGLADSQITWVVCVCTVFYSLFHWPTTLNGFYLAACFPELHQIRPVSKRWIVVAVFFTGWVPFLPPPSWQLKIWWASHQILIPDERVVNLVVCVCVCKTVGYNIMPVTRNEDGLVALTIDRKMADVCDNQQGIVDTLQRIIISNNQTSAFLCIDGIRPLLDNK